MSKTTFGRLFEPVSIGRMTVRNRIAMAPMSSSMATKDGLVTRQMLDYYEARARGGVGMVIVESTNVDSCHGIHAPDRLTLDTDLAIPGFTQLVRVIKKHGATAVLQFNHYGGHVKFKLSGFQPVAPSAMPYPQGSTKGEMARELTVGEIHEVANFFARAAIRAKRAGFEGVEIHAAHCYLLAEFLSPATNKRRDEYGGSIENRARILVEVLKATREATGGDFSVWCRINAQESGLDGGFTLDDAKAVAKMINPIVDAIHVTVFGYGKRALANFTDTPGALLPLAHAIKQVVTVPVIAIGRLDLQTGEQAIRDGKADIIAMGRRLIADPELPAKALAGSLDDIRPCIACFSCHDAGVWHEHRVTCAVNATVGTGAEYQSRPAKKIRRIAVIGGGPAGMEAARVLASRGHKVVLMEKGPHLGGQLRLAAVAPTKRERIEPLIAYLETQLKKLGVEVRLNTEANIEVVEELKPDVVILATGVTPLIPRLPGVDLDNVVTAFDVLAGQADASGKVVVIGGGSVGLETAEFLFEKGRDVTVVEMLPQLAADMGARDRTRLMTRLTKLPINFVVGAKCLGIQKEGVLIARAGKEELIKADTVVLAVGARPSNSLFPMLRAMGFETHLAGDCWHVGRIFDAIGDGLRLGCAI